MTADDGREQVEELAKVADRLLIVGLDGATFDVLDPMMDQGLMPTLKQLIDTGAGGVLRSTKPPITPAAWTTLMTGKGPGRHGVIDFERYDPETNTLSFNSTIQIKEKTIWQILTENNLTCGTIHLPMTYPPQPVNGFVVSGFETPSIDAEFTYPRDLKRIILEQIPDYSYSTNWQRGLFGGMSKYHENLEYIKRNFRQEVQLARLCTEQYGWHVLMVLFKLVDNVQHKCWKFLTAEGAKKYPTQHRMACSCFQVLDECLAELLELARDQGASIIIMSDHGHGSLDGRAQPNQLLKRWGFLHLISSWSQFRTRADHMWYRLTKKRGGRFAQPNMSIERDLAIDWTRTKACVMHAGMYGFLYISLKGRQPNGVVDPNDYDDLRNDLIERFIAARDEKTGQPVFQEVLKPEEAYNCSSEADPSLPDLMLVPATGLAVVRKIRGRNAVNWALNGRLGGTHREEGIFVVNSPNIIPGKKRDANIADMTPTILAMLGLEVPADMEGKALTDLFEPPLKVVFRPPRKLEPKAVPEEVYSEEEQRLLTERLSDLGYLE